jgi:hypothetical protein
VWTDITGKTVVSDVGKSMRWRNGLGDARTYYPTEIYWSNHWCQFWVVAKTVHISVMPNQVTEVEYVPTV